MNSGWNKWTNENWTTFRASRAEFARICFDKIPSNLSYSLGNWLVESFQIYFILFFITINELIPTDWVRPHLTIIGHTFKCIAPSLAKMVRVVFFNVLIQRCEAQDIMDQTVLKQLQSGAILASIEG